MAQRDVSARHLKSMIVFDTDVDTIAMMMLAAGSSSADVSRYQADMEKVRQKRSNELVRTVESLDGVMAVWSSEVEDV